MKHKYIYKGKDQYGNTVKVQRLVTKYLLSISFYWVYVYANNDTILFGRRYSSKSEAIRIAKDIDYKKELSQFI